MGTGLAQPKPLPPNGQICHQCGTLNPTTQSFCGSCGSPLKLGDYISKRVSDDLATAIRDRDVLETESSIRVFERAWGWVKIVGTIAAALLAIVGAGVIWKVSDWWHAVDSAKGVVTQTAADAQKQIGDTSTGFLKSIENASSAAQTASNQATASAKEQSQLIAKTAAGTRVELAKEGDAVKKEVADTQTQLDAAKALRPSMEQTQKQLASALEQVQAQQKAISSSQNFIKEVFSSFTTDITTVNLEPNPKFAVIPPIKGRTMVLNGKDITVVYVLLHATPIQGTVQLQWGVFAQPRNSYIMVVHNLFVTFWADPPGSLANSAFNISYFPDTSDKDLIQTLSVKDGRVYADGEPLPKIGQPDPDFKGDKWIQMPQTAVPQTHQ